MPGPLRQSKSELLGEELDAKTLLACLAEFSDNQLLRTEYDLGSLAWLLDFMNRTKGHGKLRKLVLLDSRRDLVGWYIYFVKRAGVGEVVQIGGRPKFIGQILDHLFGDAWEHGTVALHGRFDPRHVQELRERCCFFYRRGSWLLVHSRYPELQQCVLSGNALLTRLDGEWALGFAAEP
jgi:hypothetical protein